MRRSPSSWVGSVCPMTISKSAQIRSHKADKHMLAEEEMGTIGSLHLQILSKSWTYLEVKMKLLCRLFQIRGSSFLRYFEASKRFSSRSVSSVCRSASSLSSEMQLQSTSICP